MTTPNNLPGNRAARPAPASPRSIAFGLIAGLVSAAVFYSANGGAVGLGLLLFIATPLPSFIAGFGWGLPAAIAAAVSGAVAIATVSSFKFAIGYLLVLGIPVAGITHLAFLARYERDGTLADWYPIGRILLAIALYGAALPILVIALSGGSYKILEPDFARYLKQMSASAPIGSGFRNLSEPDIRAFASLWADVMPAAVASYWTFFCVLNVYVAARVARVSGLLVRPWPNFHWLTLPRATWFAFFAAIAGVMAGGALGVIGIGALGAFLVTYLLQGLSVVHAIARAKAPWLLFAIYATLAVAGAIAVPLTAITGLIENLARVRSRVVPQPAALPPGSI